MGQLRVSRLHSGRDQYEYGWLNIGRTFSEPTGLAANRKDILTIAMHEIGHALGLDDTYSGLHILLPGGAGPLQIKPPLPFAGSTYFLRQGPHVEAPGQDLQLMIAFAQLANDSSSVRRMRYCWRKSARSIYRTCRSRLWISTMMAKAIRFVLSHLVPPASPGPVDPNRGEW
jgi:hypothetical protein